MLISIKSILIPLTIFMTFLFDRYIHIGHITFISSRILIKIESKLIVRIPNICTRFGQRNRRCVRQCNNNKKGTRRRTKKQTDEKKRWRRRTPFFFPGRPSASERITGGKWPLSFLTFVWNMETSAILRATMANPTKWRTKKKRKSKQRRQFASHHCDSDLGIAAELSPGCILRVESSAGT